jgi:hypothetical protein
MSTRLALGLAVLAIVLSLAALYMIHNIKQSVLQCTYRTYINATWTHGKCEFNIPAEPNTWYKIIEVECRGTGVLALYLVTDEYTHFKVVGTNDVVLYMMTNDSAVLPVAGTVKYEFYVMTEAPAGKTEGTVLIAEIS